MDSQQRRLNTWLLAAVLIALVVGIYWPTLSNDFVSDDHQYTEHAQKLSSIRGLMSIWFDPTATPQFYPLTNTMFWIQYNLWGFTPLGYHVVNLIEQIITVLLAWRLLALLEVPGAWLAAALFAVHPVHVDTVAWVSEQKNLLSCLLAIGSILAYLRFAPPLLLGLRNTPNSESNGSWFYYWLSLFLYTAAVLSKTVAVTVPPVLLVIFWWKSGRIAWKEAIRLIPFLVVGIALSLVTVFVETVLLGASGEQWNLSWPARLLVAGRAICFYVTKLVWPSPLKFMYERWNIDPTSGQQYLYVIMVATVLVLLWIFRKQIGRGPLAAALLFIGIMAPALGFFNIHFFLYSYVADHFQYHASIALFALAAATIVLVTEKTPRAALALQILIAVILLTPLGILARQRTFVYHDNSSLETDNIQDNPNSWTAQYDYGLLKQEEGKSEEALKYYHKALELFPTHGEIHNSIGLALASLSRYDEAIIELEKAISMGMTRDDTYFAEATLAEIFARQGNLKTAIIHYQKALTQKPTAAFTLYKYSLILRQAGDRQAAFDAVQKSLKIDPDNADSQHLVGMLLSEANQLKDAHVALTRAVELKPDNAGFQEDLAMVLFKLNRFDLAATALKRATEINPKSANAWIGLGAIYGQRGDINAAIVAFQEAVKADPSNKQAVQNLQKAIKERDSAKQATPTKSDDSPK